MLGKIKRFADAYLKKRYREVYVDKIQTVDTDVLKGRIALITGSSEGIGFGIARSFILGGGTVILTGRNEEKLKRAQNQLGKEHADYLVWDAADISIIETNLRKAIKCFGKIDILVNNAGVMTNQDFWSVTEREFDIAYQVNVKNVFFMSQAIGRYMVENHIEGNILNISSASSMKPAWSPYTISKWACRGFTRGLARELAPYGIVVNGIAPGPAATAMSNWEGKDSLSFPALPKGRVVLPEEIGSLAVFLCSGLGRNIMGETIFCDGGSGLLTTNK